MPGSFRFTSEEKDAIQLEAAAAYEACYGKPQSDMERYYVQKGIESMAAVLYDKIEYPDER